jgi:hypothetical protein
METSTTDDAHVPEEGMPLKLSLLRWKLGQNVTFRIICHPIFRDNCHPADSPKHSIPVITMESGWRGSSRSRMAKARGGAKFLR